MNEWTNDCFVFVTVVATAIIATAAAVPFVLIVFESVNVSLSHRNATKNAL